MAPSSGNDVRLVKDIPFTVPVSAEEDAATIITSLAAFPLAVKTVNWFVPFSTNPILSLTAVPPPKRATSGSPLAQVKVAKLSQVSANADPAKAHMNVSRRTTRPSRVPNGGEGIVIFLTLELCILSAKQTCGICRDPEPYNPLPARHLRRPYGRG